MSKSNIVPRSGQVLIRVNNERKSETKSGLIIAKQGEAWQEDNLVAEVMNIADGETEFKIGDLCLIRGYEGKWLNPEFFGEENISYLYRMIERDAVLGFIRPELSVA